MPIANGGTGATTAAAAATNLAVLPVTRNTTAPTGTTRYNCEGYLYATRLYGSVYQDYAECRKGVTASEHTPGRWYRDENGTLHDKKPGRYSNAFIMSDTFGQLIGVSDENSIPVALSGRVLAYVDNKAELKSGDVLGTSKRNRGALSKLNRLERILHPEWIVGTVSEIPSYPKWNGIRVDGRVWVNVR
ncbi:hypothetical protein FACS1894184_13650 [Clostridia bacterium]|nr:hypothetical protein FACS1894184_13650 [Clostridia bacterium]